MSPTYLGPQAPVTHDIFISFSSRDRLVADSLKQYLEAHGTSCWMSAVAIDAGEVWTRAIVDGISGARAMVLILSASSNGSEHVRREIYLARERHLRILPFRIDGVEPDGDLAYNLAGIQWIQGGPVPTAAEFERLSQSVRGYLGRGAGVPATTDAPVAIPPPEPPLPPVETRVEQMTVAAPHIVDPPPETDPAEPLDSPSSMAVTAASAQPAPQPVESLPKPTAEPPPQAVPAEPMAVTPADEPEPGARELSAQSSRRLSRARTRLPHTWRGRLALCLLTAALVLALGASLWAVNRGEDTLHVSSRTYKSVAAADSDFSSSTCGIREDDTVECWSGTFHEPAGKFVSISKGFAGVCGLRTDGTAGCWNSLGDLDGTPSGQFTQVVSGWIPCGIRADGTAVCWRASETDVATGAALPPPGVKFAMLGGVSFDSGSPYPRFGCGVTVAKALQCWGTGIPAPPASLGPITAVGVGDSYACALKVDASVACWGKNNFRQTESPAGTFTAISVGDVRACGIGPDRRVECWGLTLAASPPAGQFTSLDVGGSSACGIRTDGKVVCWGDNKYGQLDAPR